MLNLLYGIFFFILLAYGMYKIITGSIRLPSKSAIENLQNFQNDEGGVLDDLKKVFIRPAANVIAPHISIDRYKREKMARNLKRAGYKENPEHFYATGIVRSIYMALAGVFVMIAMTGAFRGIGIALIVLAVIMYFAYIDKVNDKLKERNDKILAELPRFIRTYNHSRSQNTPLATIIEKYRMVAGDSFKYDLDMLITDLRTMNEDEALRSFDTRINIPHLSQFVSAIISTLHGVNQDMYFSQLEREMNVLARENIKREINKRPDKVKTVTLISACLFFVVILYPLIVTLMESLAVFS